jgi:hypothetical protein
LNIYFKFARLPHKELRQLTRFLRCCNIERMYVYRIHRVGHISHIFWARRIKIDCLMEKLKSFCAPPGRLSFYWWSIKFNDSAHLYWDLIFTRFHKAHTDIYISLRISTVAYFLLEKYVYPTLSARYCMYLTFITHPWTLFHTHHSCMYLFIANS